MRYWTLLCVLCYVVGVVRTKVVPNNTSSVPDVKHMLPSNVKPANFSNVTNIVTNTIQRASENVSLSGHMGREHEIDSSPINRTKSLTLKVTNQDERKFDPTVQKDDEKLSVPKKGVSLPGQLVSNYSLHDSALVNKTTVINSIIKVHKKPLVTESDDSVESFKDSVKNTIKLEQIDPVLLHKKSQRSDYIVPIVAVILSVPLVAVLISVLYKRGMDWWLHRNYKRMDFLIEGMYQT